MDLNLSDLFSTDYSLGDYGGYSSLYPSYLNSLDYTSPTWSVPSFYESSFLSNLGNSGGFSGYTGYGGYMNGGMDLGLSNSLGSGLSFLNGGGGGYSGGSGGNFLSGLFGGAGKFGIPLALALGGGLLSGYGTTDQAELEKKKKQAEQGAKSTAATQYQTDVQAGKDEARSEYLQNQAAERAALTEKLSRKTAESGGAGGGSKSTEKLRRSQAENYGNFLLNLAQTSTPSYQSYLDKYGTYDYETPSFGSTTASGLSSTLGSLASMALLYSMKDMFQ